LILAVVVAVFVWDRLPVGMVVAGTALSLWATGVLDYEQVFAGFGHPTVIFIASLFVVSEGLDAAGVTPWAGQKLIARINCPKNLAGTCGVVAWTAQKSPSGPLCPPHTGLIHAWSAALERSSKHFRTV
jgi:Na+/H+ antiporter NhaD/arsenite permease-like protein